MDSANILSILASLGGNGQDPSGGGAPAPSTDPTAPAAPAAPATNVMQAAAPQPPQSPAPRLPADTQSQIASAANADSPPTPKPRRSLLDTIGRISDVLATVGGAAPLYQPSLDAATARATAASDHDLATQKAKLDLETGKFDLGDKQTTAANSERDRFANVLGAINDADDAANMPAAMQAAGLTDPKYAPFIKMVQANPDVAKTLASSLGGGDTGENGKTIKFGYDEKGNRVAFTVDGDGNTHILQGVTPDANFKIVNQGDRQTALGPNGKPQIVLPVHESPNTVATTAQSDTNNRRTTGTAITIAGMPARPKAAAANSKGVEDPNIPMYLQNIQQGFNDLHGMQALPGEGGALNQVEGAIGRSAIGQKIGEQAGMPAAQKRLEITKNASLLQQAMLKSLPASATRTKYEQEILARALPDPSKMNLNTANTVIKQLYAGYQNTLAAANKAAQSESTPAASTSGNSKLPTYSPEQVRALKLPSGTRFLGTDGQERFVH